MIFTVHTTDNEDETLYLKDANSFYAELNKTNAN